MPQERGTIRGRSLPASPQALPLLNSSVPDCPEPVTPINRGCIHQEGAWAVSALKPGKTSGSCQLEVGEVGRFLPGSRRAGLGRPAGSPDTVRTRPCATGGRAARRTSVFSSVQRKQGGKLMPHFPVRRGNGVSSEISDLSKVMPPASGKAPNLTGCPPLCLLTSWRCLKNRCQSLPS